MTNETLLELADELENEGQKKRAQAIRDFLILQLRIKGAIKKSNPNFTQDQIMDYSIRGALALANIRE